MRTSRRTFAALVGAAGASVPWWDRAVAEVQAQGALTDDTVRTLLAGHGGVGIFANPERFAELKAALERSAVRLATLRAFPLPADVAPAVTFTRD